MNSEEAKSVTKALAAMFSCFPQSPSADVDMQLRGYLKQLVDMKATGDDALMAIGRFSRGEVPDANPAFCPSSAQLCAQVRWCANLRASLERRSKLKLVPGVA